MGCVWLFQLEHPSFSLSSGLASPRLSGRGRTLILQVLLPELLTLAWELVLWLGQVHNLSTERLLSFPHTILPRQHPKVLCAPQ